MMRSMLMVSLMKLLKRTLGVVEVLQRAQGPVAVAFAVAVATLD